MYALLSAKREDGPGLFTFIKQNAANIHEKKSKKKSAARPSLCLSPKRFFDISPSGSSIYWDICLCDKDMFCVWEVIMFLVKS